MAIEKKLYNLTELSEVLMASPSTVRDHISRGLMGSTLPQGFKVGRSWRWRIIDVENWLTDRAAAGEKPRANARARVVAGVAEMKRQQGRPTKAEQIQRRQRGGLARC